MAAERARRPYRSPRHAELRNRTRRDVVAAAERLFSERGYPQTTIQGIAAEAGVAVPTVYAAFGNKRAILLALLDIAVAGDDQPRPVIERIAEEVNRAADPYERLTQAMRFGARLVERSAAIYRITSSAAVVDPAIASELTAGRGRRYDDAQAIVNLVADPGTDIRARQRAADVLFTVHSYEVYELLVNTRGWTPQRWAQWARDNVARELFGDTHRPIEAELEEK